MVLRFTSWFAEFLRDEIWTSVAQTKKRQRTAALQKLRHFLRVGITRQRLGVRLSSAALERGESLRITLDVRDSIRTLNLEQKTLNCDARRVRRRWKILLFGLCGLIALVAVCFFCFHENRPSYNGRSLSEWLDDIEYIGGREGQREAGVAAIRAIGTNACPVLLKWSSAKDSTWQRELHTILISSPRLFRAKWMYTVIDFGRAVRQQAYAVRL